MNPAHLDEEFARNDMFHKIIAHGKEGVPLLFAGLVLGGWAAVMIAAGA